MTTKRLSLSTLHSLPAGIQRPRYEVADQPLGIVHLGIGAFHRAHQAVYVDDCLAAGERGWAILGASLRSPRTRDALGAQDGLYTLIIRSDEEQNARVIGSVRRVLYVPQELDTLLEAMCAPAIRIVTLTVTEKGYCHDPATGELADSHPDIRHDLSTPHLPRSAPGILVEAIRRRRSAKVAPFTVLCCDNLPQNGRTVRRIVTRLAELIDPDLARYVAGEVAFPSTMVDRIVPATTDRDCAELESLGVRDAWPISAEPFSQWVIENHFASGRPRFEDSGAELVADVAPYEEMKLRLLNGAHSSLAYLGYLAGHETIDSAVADPVFARFIRRLMDEEVTPTLKVPSGFDVTAYKERLLSRFANKALQHRTWQIAMDGSQKLPQRLLNTVRERLRAGAPIERLALAVAGWMRYVAGVDEDGRPIDVRDPMADRFARIVRDQGTAPDGLVSALHQVNEIFGDDLGSNPNFVSVVRQSFENLARDGAKRTVGRMG